MRFVVSQDVSSGLWNWELLAAEGGSIAKSAAGFSTLEQLLSSIEAIRAKAPHALVFDLLGKLDEGI